MQATRPLAIASLVFMLPLFGEQQRQAAKNIGSHFSGFWTVRFANGVIECCEIEEDGSVSTSEPKRSASGEAEAKEGAIVIKYKDDRMERWTVVGTQMVVEHWFPAAKYPDGPRVLGIAEKSPKPANAKEDDLRAIQGEWDRVFVKIGRREFRPRPGEGSTVTITGNRLVFSQDDAWKIKLDTKAKLKRLDAEADVARLADEKFWGVYALEKDTLTICWRPGYAEKPDRPASLDSSQKCVWLQVFKRKKP